MTKEVLMVRTGTSSSGRIKKFVLRTVRVQRYLMLQNQSRRRKREYEDESAGKFERVLDVMKDGR